MELHDIEPDDPRLLRDVLPVLSQLRTRLSADDLASIAMEGYAQGLRFLAAYDGDRCVGVAGWRLIRNTSEGRKLYVDDLVTDASHRSTGVGARVIAELTDRAAAAGCTSLELDSGVQRGDAHRFYFREGMSVSSFHFQKVILTPLADSSS